MIRPVSEICASSTSRCSIRYVVPPDLGAGRVFRIGRQYVNLFVEPFYAIAHEGPAPRWGITVGAALLYPGFWSTTVPSLTSPRGS